MYRSSANFTSLFPGIIALSIYDDSRLVQNAKYGDTKHKTTTSAEQ